MSASGALVGLLFVSSIVLAIAQSRGYRPIEGGIDAIRSRIRSDEDRSIDLDDLDPEGRAETDGGSKTIEDYREEIKETELELVSSESATQIDRDRDLENESDRWVLDDPAPVRPLRLDRSRGAETIEIEVPEGVEIEIRRDP